MRRAIGLLALGGTLALLAASCGGGGSSSAPPLDKADYVKQMQTIGKNLSNALGGLGADTGSAKKAAAALTQVQTELNTAADKIDAMNPPTDVVTEQKKLGDAVREFADELDPVIKQLQAGKLSALQALGSLKGVNDIQTTSQAIVSKGYKIGG
jgi:hypothetical protein